MTINLIPPQLKKGKVIAKAISQVSFGLFAILSLVIITGMAFYTYNLSLAKLLKTSQEKVDEQNSQLKSLRDTETTVKTINAKIGQIENTGSNKIFWSQVLTSLSNATPDAVQIKTLNISQSTMTILLTGTAITRTDIARMKEALESINKFSNVTFTTSSYNQLTNDYSFSLNLGVVK